MTEQVHLAAPQAGAASDVQADREAFEAWFEPDTDNRRSLQHYRFSDGHYSDAPYLNGCWQGWRARSAETTALRASHSALVKALEFYANNLFRRKSDGEPCIQSVIEHDAGDIARNALATAKELT